MNKFLVTFTDKTTEMVEIGENYSVLGNDYNFTIFIERNGGYEECVASFNNLHVKSIVKVKYQI